MTRYISLAPTSEIEPGQREIFDVDGLWIAVFNVGGEYYAIEDVCTHDGGPLAEGDVYGYEIECPRHGARFDLRSGAVTRMPAVVPVPWYPVRVENGEIQVGIED